MSARTQMDRTNSVTPHSRFRPVPRLKQHSSIGLVSAVSPWVNAASRRPSRLGTATNQIIVACATWLTGLTGWRRAAADAGCDAGAAGKSEAVACEGAADIFCAETTPKAARPRIIKTATMAIIKRILPLGDGNPELLEWPGFPTHWVAIRRHGMQAAGPNLGSALTGWPESRYHPAQVRSSSEKSRLRGVATERPACGSRTRPFRPLSPSEVRRVEPCF